MDLDKAIKKVGKIMGNHKFHCYMDGERLPSGNLSPAGTISAIFNADYAEVDLRLCRLMQVQYEKCRAEHNARIRKSDREWQERHKNK